MLSWAEKIVSISDDESGLSRRIAAVTLSLKQAQLTASVIVHGVHDPVPVDAADLLDHEAVHIGEEDRQGGKAHTDETDQDDCDKTSPESLEDPLSRLYQQNVALGKVKIVPIMCLKRPQNANRHR